MLDSRLRYAVAVAQCGSFTRAADLVGVTQSGVTKSITDLEQEIGYAIFYRTARGATLTADGRDFIERAARLLEDAKTLLQGRLDPADPYSGVLRIGVCPASLEWMLAAPLSLLLRKHGSIKFEIVGSSFERIVDLLRNGSLDVAVGFAAAFEEWPELRREHAGELCGDLFVRIDHPILKRTALSVDDLADYDFVGPSDSRPYGKAIREVYERQGIDWRKHLHIVDNFAITKRIVATTDAIAFASYQFMNTSAFGRHFVRLEGVNPFVPAALCCAVRSRWDPSPPARAFINVMRAPDTHAL